jgi:hypothetical protein
LKTGAQRLKFFEFKLEFPYKISFENWRMATLIAFEIKCKNGAYKVVKSFGKAKRG